MPQIIKPRTLGLLHKVERRRDGARFIISAIAAFDLADPSKLDGEQSLWLMAADALPPGTPIDAVMPKPRAEMLIAGKLNAPHAAALMLEARFAGLSKRLAVFGDRWWSLHNEHYVATEPRPIGELLLSPARSFGGKGHPANPMGMGFAAVDQIGAGAAVALPNIEDPSCLVQSVVDEPPTVRFGPLDVMDPSRQRLAGTYDASWARDVAPGLADDVHPDFFMTAPEDQRLKTYLVGNEAYWLHNFGGSGPVLEGHLPGIKPRAFVGQNNGQWTEVFLPLDTVWFVAGARRGILVWHGVMPVEDIQGKDVTDVMLVYERLREPRSIEHYAEVRELRRDRATAVRYAFSEWQLAPTRDPAEEERRKAARLALAEERAAKMAEGIAYKTKRMFDEVGLPEALRPPPPGSDQPPLLLPLPTPEEIESGDFDLGDVLDVIEEQKAKADESLRALAEMGEPMLEALQATQVPGAGAKEVEALMAAAAPLTSIDMASELDNIMARVAMKKDENNPEKSEAMQEKLSRIKDWRLILDEQGKIDDDILVQDALGRFLNLPKYRSLEAAREGVRKLGDIPPLDMSKLPDGAAKLKKERPSAVSIDHLLENIQSQPSAPENLSDGIKGRLAAADETLSNDFPNLKAGESGTMLDALLVEVIKMAPPREEDPIGAMANFGETLEAERADLLAKIDEAEVKLDEGKAIGRLSSPMAHYPLVPMTPYISRRFGEGVLEQIEAGLSLAKRDLAGVDLSGADLSGLDLSGAFLERANLTDAKLRGANLTNATLAEALLEQADFTGAQLQGANLSGVKGRGMCLDDTELTSNLILKADFSNASAQGTVFTGTRFIEVDFSGADFTGSSMERVLFLRVSASDARFSKGTLHRCQFVEADLSDASIDDAFLDRCTSIKLTASRLSAVRVNLRSCSFNGAQLDGADFSEANAGATGFFGADLTGAVFRRAICDRALFGDAKLQNADFHLASLRHARFDSAHLYDADFIGAQLMEAQLFRADLRWARFHRANLYGADLRETSLMGCDFTGAHLVKSALALETVHG